MNAKALAVALLAFAATPAAAQDAAPPGAAACSGCHPPAPAEGIAVPVLHARSADEIAAAMRAFKAGQLQPTVMDRIAKGFTDEEVQAIAAWFAAQR